MKKLLFGTTALAAVGMLAGTASAADRIKMGVGGYWQGFFVFGDEKNGTNQAAAGRRDHKVAREGEIIFNGKTTLDNGIQFGVQVQLEAETCGDQIDETFAWASGSFGRINLGSENSAAYLMHYASPAPSGWSHGLNSPNFSHATTGGFTNFLHTNPVSLTTDSEKITYFTPRLAGFQLGASYTPERCEEANGGTGAASCSGSYAGFQNKNNNADTDNRSEAWELGANYVNKLGATDLAVSIGYGQGKPEVKTTTAGAARSDDYKEWAVGGRVGWSGWTLGAAYREDNRGRSGNNDRTDANIGLRYATGPWGVGIQYAVAEQKTNGVKDEVTAFEVGGSYDLGPGVQLQAGVQYWEADTKTNTAQSANGKSTIVFIGTFLAF